MAQASVTSGNDLNSYQGNAALAGGVNETGFAPMDFSPLEVFALKKYETNQLNYEQQQKDKVALEKMYFDPKLNVFLDSELAGQIDPLLDELKALAKLQVYMNPKSQDWYKVHDVYNDILKKNANAKTVQTLKDDAREKAGASTDKHEKENYTAFADKLKNYKLGDEIPVNNIYFPSLEEYIPTGETAKWKVEKPSPDGKSKSIVEKSVNNSLGLMKAYDRLQIVDPESQNTWKNMAHVALEDVYDDKGSGGLLLDNLNKTTADVYQKNKDYNISLLQGKYNTEYKEFLKANPKATFDNFLAADPVKQKELQDIKDGLSFLNGDVVVKSAADDPKRFAGFTYFQDKDGKLSRLSINDKEFAARYGATKNLPGEKETLVSTKLDETGAKIALLDAKRNLVNEQAKTQGTVRAKNRAMEKLTNKNIEALTPAETYDEVFAGKTESYLTKAGNIMTRVNVQNMTTDHIDNLDILPLNQNGDFNIVPANVTFNGKQLTTNDVYRLHKQWLATNPSDYKTDKERKQAENTVKKNNDFYKEMGRYPDVFEFMSSQKGVSYGVPEMEGLVKPVIKQIKLNPKQEYIDVNGKKKISKEGGIESVLMNPESAYKVGRSNKLQSWTKQRSKLKVTGKNLIKESEDVSEQVNGGSTDLGPE